MPFDNDMGVVSLRGRRWSVRESGFPSPAGAESLVRQVVRRRGMTEAEAAAFLEPNFGRDLPDPFILKGMTEAVARIADAVEHGEGIGILGDYDVDGATSTAIMIRFLRMAGARDPIFHIPHRIEEGYGANTPALLGLQARGCGLVITVDNGTTATGPLTDAKAAGLDVVVIDHHACEPGKDLPPAVAIVNPNRIDEKGEPGAALSHMCAAGLSFLTCLAVTRELARRGWYKERPEPKLTSLLELAALGTVADVVPLHGINRLIVALGLKVMQKRGNPGIAAMAQTAGLKDGEPFKSVRHCGFCFGPRINAAGRIADQTAGARLLITDDAEDALRIAQELELVNQDRKALCEQATEAGIRQVEQELIGDAVLIVTSDEWHPGIIGIVAGRLKERYDRPCFVITFDAEGYGKSSARSVPGWNIGEHVHAAKHEDLLVAGGGHPMAAGLTVKRENLEAFRAFILARTEGLGATVTQIDAVVGIDEIVPDDITALACLEPFGAGNDEPRFMIRDAVVRFAKTFGKDGKHLMITFEGPGGARIKGKIWSGAGTDFGETLMENKGRRFDLVGRLAINEWPEGVVNPEIIVEDARPA